MYECGTCTATFWSKYECDDHMDDYDHWPECETCDRTFRTQRACQQHMNDTDHWRPRFECETCTMKFRTQNAVNQHMTATRHHAPRLPCQRCNRKFHTQAAANQHMDALNHWAPDVRCETCTQKFYSQQAADQHMKALGHYSNYCKDCDRRFQSENNLRMHLNSKVHRGSSVICPFCREKYTSASGVTHHLERGACLNAPNVNRETLFQMIRERDRNGTITNKQLEWNGGVNITYSATSRAYNGNYWECYICHREFGTIHGLNAHLNSPVHQQKVYHCPNAKVKCGGEFTTLAALFNHLESEACALMRFENVQKQVTNVLQGRKLLAF